MFTQCTAIMNKYSLRESMAHLFFFFFFGMLAKRRLHEEAPVQFFFFLIFYSIHFYHDSTAEFIIDCTFSV